MLSSFVINVIYLEGHSPVDIAKVGLIRIAYQVFHRLSLEILQMYMDQVLNITRGDHANSYIFE